MTVVDAVEFSQREYLDDISNPGLTLSREKQLLTRAAKHCRDASAVLRGAAARLLRLRRASKRTLSLTACALLRRGALLGLLRAAEHAADRPVEQGDTVIGRVYRTSKRPVTAPLVGQGRAAAFHKDLRPADEGGS